MFSRAALRCSALVLLSLAWATPAGAARFTQPDSLIRFALPPDWETLKDGKHLIALSPDHTITLTFWAAEQDSGPAALQAALTEQKRQFRKLRVNQAEPRQTRARNLEMWYLNGEAERVGVPVIWELSVLMGAKPLVWLLVAETGAIARHEDAIAQIFTSFQRVPSTQN